MSIAGATRVRNEMCTMRLRVDDHKSGEIAGRLFNAYYQNPIFSITGFN